jgi:predicted nucleotidyltransferase
VTGNVRLTGAEATTLPTILRTVSGSEVHGTGLPGGDVDHLGFAVESRDDVLGIGSSPESWSFRTAWARAVDEGSEARSRHGDLDLMVYPARKWARLALGGNPTVLTPLFVGEEWIVSVDDFGLALRENRHRLMSKKLVRKFLGYSAAQFERMQGLRSNRVSRPELVSEHGFDTKFAGHTLRLAYQGLMAASTGTIPMPLEAPMARFILDVRQGKYSAADVAEAYQGIVAQAESALAASELPDKPDDRWLAEWLSEVQLATWARSGDDAGRSAELVARGRVGRA